MPGCSPAVRQRRGAMHRGCGLRLWWAAGAWGFIRYSAPKARIRPGQTPTLTAGQRCSMPCCVPPLCPSHPCVPLTSEPAQLRLPTHCHACYSTCCTCCVQRCLGDSPDCPEDDVLEAGVVCRKEAPGGCDVEEKCDGKNKTCPPGQSLPGKRAKLHLIWQVVSG